jgi:hypothetical protein
MSRFSKDDELSWYDENGPAYCWMTSILFASMTMMEVARKRLANEK